MTTSVARSQPLGDTNLCKLSWNYAGRFNQIRISGYWIGSYKKELLRQRVPQKWSIWCVHYVPSLLSLLDLIQYIHGFIEDFESWNNSYGLILIFFFWRLIDPVLIHLWENGEKNIFNVPKRGKKTLVYDSLLVRFICKSLWINAERWHIFFSTHVSFHLIILPAGKCIINV